MASEFEHHRIARLLPWYVNQSLSSDEAAAVSEHLGTCLTCRRDLTFLSKVRGDVQAAADLPATAEPGLASLLAKIDGRSRAPHRYRLVNAIGWLMVPAALALTAVVLLPGPSERAAFRTMSSEPSDLSYDGARIRVVFDESLDEADRTRLLERARLTVLDVSGSPPIYTLSVERGQEQAALDELREEPAVLFVQPLAPGP